MICENTCSDMLPAGKIEQALLKAMFSEMNKGVVLQDESVNFANHLQLFTTMKPSEVLQEKLDLVDATRMNAKLNERIVELNAKIDNAEAEAFAESARADLHSLKRWKPPGRQEQQQQQPQHHPHHYRSEVFQRVTKR